MKAYLHDCGHDPDCLSLHEVYSHLMTVPECFPQIIRCALIMGISSGVDPLNGHHQLSNEKTKVDGQQSSTYRIHLWLCNHTKILHAALNM